MTMTSQIFTASPYPGVTVRVAVEVEVPQGCEVIHVSDECVLNWFWNRAIKRADATPEKLGELLMIQKADGTYYDDPQEGK